MTIRFLASLAAPLHAVTVKTVAASTLLASGPPALPGFLNALSSPLQHFGLWAILLLVLVEDFGIPVPGETVLIAGAIYAGAGRLNVVALAAVAFGAAVVGDNIGYAIGRFGGRALADRWGKYIFLTPQRLDAAEGFFNRHGSKIIVVARFVEGLRQANGIIAGIARMHWLRFLIFNAIGAALWVGAWVSVGYFAGKHIDTIYKDITDYSLYAAIAAVVIIAVVVTLRVRKRRREKRADVAAAEDEDEDEGDSKAEGQDESNAEGENESKAEGGSEAEAETPDEPPETAGRSGTPETAGTAGSNGSSGASETSAARHPGYGSDRS